MSKSTSPLASVIAALERASAELPAHQVVASTEAEDLNESLIKIPRTPQFWAKELRDLARCRAILDQDYDKMVEQHINSITDKVGATVAKGRITMAFLENILNLSYASTIDFINAFEERLKRFGHDLPDRLVAYRTEIGLGDGKEDDEDDEQPDTGA